MQLHQRMTILNSSIIKYLVDNILILKNHNLDMILDYPFFSQLDDNFEFTAPEIVHNLYIRIVELGFLPENKLIQDVVIIDNKLFYLENIKI